jgi:hypothetical protein
MPLRRMLEGRNFDPKAAAVLVEAFNEIIDELDLRTPAERVKAAKIVIELAAGKATLDAATLQAEAVRLIRNDIAGVHGPDLGDLAAAGRGAAADGER